MWCFLSSRYKKKVFFQDMTPELWLTYANYLLGDKCYLMQVPTPGQRKGQDRLVSIAAALDCGFELRV